MAQIVLLYSDTGGGHRTSAHAIEQGFRLAFGDAHRVVTSNAIGMLPWPFSRSEETYASSIRSARWLHALNFHALNGRARMRLVGRLGARFDGARLRRWAETCDADVVVSCQPHFNAFVPRALQRARGSRMPRYVHVVTDLEQCHAFHFTPREDLLVTPTDEACNEALAHGIAPDRIVVCGQPVMPDFKERVALRAGARAQHGLRPDSTVVLVLGGGEGMGALTDTALALAQSDLPIEVAVVCGRNAQAQTRLTQAPARAVTRVFGFVDTIPELMGAADILVTKAGALTVAEAFIAGLPIILFDTLSGEEGNRRLAVEHGVAMWCPTPASVVAQTRAWVNQPDALCAARRAAQRMARPNAAVDIARAIGALL